MQDIKIPCKKCEGTGGVVVDGYEVDCGRCRGNGYIYVCPSDLNRVKDYCEEQIYYHNKNGRLLSEVGKGSLMAYGEVLSFIERIQEK